MTQAPDAENMMMDGAFSVEQVSEFASISKTEVREQMKNGRLPYLAIGRRRLVPKRAVYKFLTEHLVTVADATV